MKTIETQWIKTSRQRWGKAKIYRTSGGKLALKVFIGYGGDIEPNMVTPTEPRYYRSVQLCFRALGYLGLEQGVTIKDIEEVLES